MEKKKKITKKRDKKKENSKKVNSKSREREKELLLKDFSVVERRDSNLTLSLANKPVAIYTLNVFQQLEVA